MSAQADKLDRLKRAGFSIGYATPQDVYKDDRVHSAYVHTFPYDETERPFVIVRGATGEDMASQSTTVDRSNFRSLQRDYGRTFVEVGYSHTDGLGFFPHSVSEEVVDMVIGLVEQYPVYDESDLSDLEWTESQESFRAFAYDDWRNHASDEWIEVDDLFTLDEIEEAFWHAQSESGDYPEHNGLDVLWIDDTFADLMETALCALVAEHYAPPRQAETLV